MTKKTLLFDASGIAENIGSGSGRSGIFFVSINILNCLIKSGNFDVSLWCRADSNNVKFIDFAKEKFGKNVQIYFGNKFYKITDKMFEWDANLRKSHMNIIKLLLNIFIRKPLNWLGRNIVVLPRFDIALSPMYAFSNKIKADKKYIILHDTIPLLLTEYYLLRGDKKHWFYKLVRYIKSGKKCKYFANSVCTKKDFIKLLDMNPNDITVMPLAAGDNFYHEKDDKKIIKILQKYNIPTDKKYVFSLCTLEPRKNLIRAVKTFIEFVKKNKIEDMVFVLGGAHWDKFIGKLEKEIKDLGEYRDKIVRAGYVIDEDLAALYSGATFFVYTSQYEGFGLPPLEAMKCGCPVITSNTSSLPEVVGDAGIMIDYDSDEQHIAAYEKYYFDKKYRDEMAKKGLNRSKQFSWEKTTDIIIEQIRKDTYN